MARVAVAARDAVVVWAVARDLAPAVNAFAPRAAKLSRTSEACPATRSSARNAARR